MIEMPAGELDEDALMELAMEIGADDVELTEDKMAIFKSAPDAFAEVLDALKSQGHDPKGELVSVAETPLVIDDVEVAEKVLKLMENIEDHDDVQNITSNMDLSEAVRAQLESDS
jgi:transcriptional/translational regulatory protein YebC/TACO1